jgi:hypothetical protein
LAMREPGRGRRRYRAMVFDVLEGVTKVFIKRGGVTGCVKKSAEPLPCGRSRFFEVGFAV